MMTMEIDMQSPSSLLPSYGHSNSTKRARSPDETNSPSRPSKRPTLAAVNVYPSSQTNHSFRNTSSAGSSRQPSEDWVQQAGSLTIDSPLFTTPSIEDYAMATESGIVQNPSTTASDTSGRPQLPPLQTSFSRTPDAKPQFTTAPILQHIAPSINVLPPTPEVTFPMGFSTVIRPSTPMTDSPMSISTSASSPNISSPSRKHRFAMGPRADCDKCKQGIKGHYLHL
ncbi:hypothetical protein BDP27DRAFT_1324676, partial [Rhodocollybia butyracea]